MDAGGGEPPHLLAPHSAPSATAAAEGSTARPQAISESLFDGLGTEGTEVSLRFLVATSDTGVLLGRGGANRREMQVLTGARLQFSRPDEFWPGTAERIMLLSGALHSVASALMLCISKLHSSQQKLLLGEGLHALSISSAAPQPEQQQQQLLAAAAALAAAASSSPSAAIASAVTSREALSDSLAHATEQLTLADVAAAAAVADGGVAADMTSQQQQLMMLAAGVEGGSPHAAALLASEPSAASSALAHALSQELATPAAAPTATPQVLTAALMPTHAIQIKLLVPAASCGLILGPGGTSLQSLNSECGVTVSLSPQDRSRGLDYERVATISGTWRSVLRALVVMVSRMMAQAGLLTPPGSGAGATTGASASALSSTWAQASLASSAGTARLLATAAGGRMPGALGSTSTTTGGMTATGAMAPSAALLSSAPHHALPTGAAMMPPPQHMMLPDHFAGAHTWQPQHFIGAAPGVAGATTQMMSAPWMMAPGPASGGNSGPLPLPLQLHQQPPPQQHRLMPASAPVLGQQAMAPTLLGGGGGGITTATGGAAPMMHGPQVSLSAEHLGLAMAPLAMQHVGGAPPSLLSASPGAATGMVTYATHPSGGYLQLPAVAPAAVAPRHMQTYALPAGGAHAMLGGSPPGGGVMAAGGVLGGGGGGGALGMSVMPGTHNPTMAAHQLVAVVQQQQLQHQQQLRQDVLPSAAVGSQVSLWVDVNFPIPELAVGAIIGAGGATLQQIKQLCSVNVVVDDRSLRDPIARTRKVHIQGTLDRVAMAQQIIEDKVQEVMQARAGGLNPGLNPMLQP